MIYNLQSPYFRQYLSSNKHSKDLKKQHLSSKATSQRNQQNPGSVGV